LLEKDNAPQDCDSILNKFSGGSDSQRVVNRKVRVPMKEQGKTDNRKYLERLSEARAADPWLTTAVEKFAETYFM
jgi:hypothetical protein